MNGHQKNIKEGILLPTTPQITNYTSELIHRGLDLAIKNNLITAEDYFKQGRERYDIEGYEKAIESFEKALYLDCKYIDALFWRGKTYSKLGEYENAIKDFTKVIKLDYKSAYSYSERANCRFSLGELSRAVKDYNTAIELDGANAKFYEERADFYKKGSEYEQAVKDYDKAIELMPNNALLYVKRGDTFLLSGNPFLYSSERNHCLYYLIAGLDSDLGDCEKALNDYNKALQLSPDNGRFYIHRAEYFRLSSRTYYKKALKDYNQAVQFSPDDYYVYLHRGVFFYKSNNYLKALKDYTKAIELNPEFDVIYHHRGDCFFDMGDTQQAIKDYNKAVEIIKNNFPTKGQLEEWKLRDIYSKIYSEVETYQVVIEDYTQAIEIDPKHRYLYYYERAELLSKIGSYQAAIEDYTQAIENELANIPDFYSGRAKCFYKTGSYQAAIKDYTQAIKLSLSRSSIHFLLLHLDRGDCFSKIENYQAAIEDCTKAIRLFTIKSNDYTRKHSSPDYYYREQAAYSYCKRATYSCKIPNYQSAVRDLKKAAKFYYEVNNLDEYEKILKQIRELQLEQSVHN